MTSSPPKPKSSSRPPAPGLDGGRLITAGAAGASVLLLSATAVVLWPRTYGAEATIMLDGNPHVENPTQLASRIEAALLEREVLASAAMDLPPELRSPDPIGRLRGGIRVQARDARGYAVEFRGSDPQSVQRIANRLADRAVAFVPKLTTSPDEAAPLAELAAKTRAVTEFLTAHPEMALEQPTDKAGRAPADDRGLDLLFTEKRQIEQRLATGATDNPYADPGDDPATLNRRLAEIKLTISRREAALKRAKTAAPAGSPELTAQWRSLLAQLAEAQAKANRPDSKPAITARVSSRAALPTSPLTPNRLVLSIVAVLLSVAAAMLAFVLPRKAAAPRRPRTVTAPLQVPPALAEREPRPTATGPAGPSFAPSNDGASAQRSDPPPGPSTGPAQPSSPPAQRSDPPPATSSQPPGPLAPMRTVVLSSAAPPARTPEASFRRRTSPGGVAAPAEAQLSALAQATTTAAPAARLFGSRPPPGAGSYSVSSSHPPPGEGVTTTVERLSPLQSQRPIAAPSTPPSAAPPEPPTTTPGEQPPIMSRPPALDPEAERWAARFETPPPAVEPPVEDSPKRAAGRWRTQVMGSMVPLDVQRARQVERPLSEPPIAHDAYAVPVPQAPSPSASTLVHHEAPTGWYAAVDPQHPGVIALRDAIMTQGLSRQLRVVVTGAAGSERTEVAGALAIALSEAGARVLLLEADFDLPQVHRVMAVTASPGAGFSQQILARRQVGQARPWIVVRCLPTLHVLAEGRFRSPGLVDLQEFERAVLELAEQHHVVLLHAPSLDRPSDLRRLDALAQAAVVVQPEQAPSIQFGNSPLRAML